MDLLCALRFMVKTQADPGNFRAWVPTLQGNKQISISVNLNNTDDEFVWKLINQGFFGVKSMYAYILIGHIVFLKKYSWKLKLKVPLNIKIFM
jgi:hypothetical protein